MITFTLHQSTAICDGPQYKVTNEVTLAEGASTAVYVYATSTKKFSHYASASDMERWPDSYDLAFLAGKDYYRDSRVVRYWKKVGEMNTDLDTSLRRLQSLADELNAQRSSLVIDRTTVVRGA